MWAFFENGATGPNIIATDLKKFSSKNLLVDVVLANIAEVFKHF